MTNSTVALSFVMFVNLLMFLGQAAVIELGGDTTNEFYNYSGNIMAEFDSNNNQQNPQLDINKYQSELPGGEGGLEISEGNIFTDTFTSIKNWVSQKLGLTYLKQVLSAPYNILSAMQLPAAFTFAVGTLWYAITLFLLISFIWGRE